MLGFHGLDGAFGFVSPNAHRQLCGMTCCNPEHTIIGGKKNVNCGLLGTGKMKSIIGAKSHGLQCLRTRDCCSRQRGDALCPAEHGSDT